MTTIWGGGTPHKVGYYWKVSSYFGQTFQKGKILDKYSPKAKAIIRTFSECLALITPRLYICL